MKSFFRVLIGVLAVLFAVGLIVSGIELIVAGKDYLSWAPSLGLGIPMLFGGLGLILNWFSKDDFLYWPF